MKLINEEGFTKVDNYFLDHVMPKVTGAEWKIVCTVLRATLGCFKDEAEISITEFMAMSRYERQAVIEAVRIMRLRGAVERRAQQNGRQRTFRFRAVPRGNLKEAPAPKARRPQSALPFDVHAITEYENQTPMTPSGPVENVSQTETKFENHTPSDARWEYENQTPNQCENQTPNDSVLIVDLDRSERSDKNASDKTEREPPAEENNQNHQGKIVELCRFHCDSPHADPLDSPAVQIYVQHFKLMPSAGFRHDIWLTVQDLLLWSTILENWWYPNASGRRVEKNPLGIKQMLNTYEEAIRRRSERGLRA